MKSIIRSEILVWVVMVCCFGGVSAQSNPPMTDVVLIGAMRDVMWKGELAGRIDLDTIEDRTHLYGLGPVENLAGEIMIWDGVAYVSTVVNAHEMRVEETFQTRAPFFGYTHIDAWVEAPMPDSIYNLMILQEYLDDITLMRRRPFFFRLTGMIDSAQIHIVNLPEGAKVSSPSEAHAGMVKYKLNTVAANILGFFSTEHQGIFTHHDSFMHLHLITADRTKMGHVDEMVWSPGALRLYVPAE